MIVYGYEPGRPVTPANVIDVAEFVTLKDRVVGTATLE